MYVCNSSLMYYQMVADVKSLRLILSWLPKQNLVMYAI